MSDQSPKRIDLPTTNPAAAYAADVTRLGRSTIGVQDDAWLTLAHTLWRLPALSAAERRTIMPATADALAVTAMALGLPQTSSVLRVATALRSLYDESVTVPVGYDALNEVVFGTQSVVEELEIAGGFALAYATLANLETAFRTQMSPRLRGNMVAQQGRALRQLGLIDLARDVYTAAMEQGFECEAMDVVARGLLGLAIIAMSRGNYPAARDLFERALTNAEVARENDLLRSAHHGLMNCGFTSGDLDAAMVHGWNVLRLCIHPDARAEALMNLAEICHLTGEHEAALRVFRVAIEWTSVPRVRLHAMSGALNTAITLQKLDVALRYVDNIEALTPRIADTYTLATVGVEVAESLYRLGRRADAADKLAQAQALAEAHSYHEVTHRAEQAMAHWRSADAEAAAAVAAPELQQAPRRLRRSEHFRTVLRSLNGLAAASL